MSLFRSDPMAYYNIVMPRENAWDILNELGELNAVQFVDQNAHDLTFNRPYTAYIKRCEDMEAKVDQITKSMVRFEKDYVKCDDPKLFLRNLRDHLSKRNRAEHTYFEEAETELDQKVDALNEQIKTYDDLTDKFQKLQEFKKVLEKTRKYIGEGFRAQNAGGAGPEESKVDYVSNRDVRFNYLAGVIATEDKERFRRILFRVTRGMAWTALEDIEPEQQNAQIERSMTEAEKQKRTVFLIVYQGGSFDMMRSKLNKVCDSFQASKYGIPEDNQAFMLKTRENEEQIRDSKNIIAVTKAHVENILDFFSQPRGGEDGEYSYIEDIKYFVAKEKAIYHNLNTLKLQNTVYHGNVWVPEESVDKVQKALSELKKRNAGVAGCEFSKTSNPAGISPPTRFRLNDVSGPYQEIVNTYGVPRYREINPALFTIATFPFMFGVMFGDIGHGALLLAAGIYLCLWKDELEKAKGMGAMLLPARYVFLFQGFFALYCGLIYNDFMAIPFNLFGTCYEEVPGKHIMKKTDWECNYPFGIDPSWYGTNNELTFLNSFKMKLAIVIGVVHMTFGILLKGLNTVYFGQWADFIFEFIPQLIFMSLTFGYMVVLIFMKWSLPWQQTLDTATAPSIIGIFIKMALQPGSYPDDAYPLYGGTDPSYQSGLQLNFLLVALICVPIILLPKPLIAYFSQASHSRPAPDNQQRLLNDEERPLNEGGAEEEHAHGHGHGGHDFGEIFVHQVIETIEFVLGTISNTASYLRLWALSLAHSQLAKVFFDNTIGAAIKSGNIITAFVGYTVFAQATFGILILMDQMECFLHALRLHWVEFQSKFYKADGYLFQPFSFETALKVAAQPKV